MTEDLMDQTLAHPAQHTVVIGAGVAGLAAAIRLAAAGQRVTLLERHETTGGKIRTTPSDAGAVDAGPTVLTMRHVFDDLFASAGARLEDHVDLVPQSRLARHFWPDGSTLDLFANREDSISAVDDFAGSRAAHEFRAFCDRAQTLFDAFDLPIMQAPRPRLTRLMAHVLARPRLIRAMAAHLSLAGLLKRQFSDPRLRQLFGRYATYVGGAPQFSPAVLALIWHAESSGVWAVRGGMNRLARAMTDLASTNGVDVITGAHVDRIALSGGRVCGLHLADATYLRADSIVFAGDPRALATGTLGAEVTGVARRTRKVARSFSARVYSFAARHSRAELLHHNVLFPDEGESEFRDLDAGRQPVNPTLYICAEDRGLPDAVPSPERFEIIVNAPPTDRGDQPEELAKWNQTIMTRIQRFGIGLTPMPSPDQITTPQMFGQMFPETCGALYGQSPHGMLATFQRPTARTHIPGLYLCGGGTHPGAGVPMATLSARHAAEAILNDRTSAFPSARMATRGGMSTA